MSDKTKTIPVTFKKSKDYRTISAHGAYGGVTPSGEVITHLFIEHETFPDDLIIEIDEKGQRIKETRNTKDLKMTRELQVGIVMSPGVAKVVGEWLISNSKKVTGEK